MKTDEALPEIIEIIDDDADVFGDRLRSTTLHDAGGPRWIAPAAAAALTLLIGYGVVSSSASNPLPKAAPAPSTTLPAPTSSVPAPTTTEAPPPVPYYAADPPREFAVADAEFGRFSRRQPNTTFQLWATEGATGTSGSWFSIETVLSFGEHLAVYLPDAYRVDTDHTPIAISHTRSGTTIAQFAP